MEIDQSAKTKMTLHFFREFFWSLYSVTSHTLAEIFLMNIFFKKKKNPL